MSKDRPSAEPTEADRAEFLAIFDANYELVLAYAQRRLTDRTDADEVAAETFEVAWRRRRDLPDKQTAWLYGVAAHVIDNRRRGARRRRRLAGKLGSQPAIRGRDPVDLVGERDAVARAFRQLSDSEREVLRLVCWEGLDAQEAAIALGCSNGAFRVRLHRARTKLAKHLDPAGHEGENATPTPIPRETK